MWNERFATSEFVFGKEPSQFLVAQADYLTPGAKALSVADGEGRNSVFMAQRGMDVTAMEFSPNAIAKAKSLADEHGVSVDFQQADIFSWDWASDSYDLVAAVFIQFMGAEARAGIFAGMKQTVKPGGLILLHGYTPKQLEYRTGGPGVAENLYTKEQLAADFDGWEILRLEEYEAELNEGPGHAGQSALIDLIARKPS